MAESGPALVLIITPITSAGLVREELARATQRKEWLEDDYWKHFLRGRRSILDAIFISIPDKDWLNPTTARRVEESFIIRAKEWWKGDDNQWVLAGAWLETRPDLVTWMRTTFWKHNQKRIRDPKAVDLQQDTGSVAGSVAPTALDTAIDSEYKSAAKQSSHAASFRSQGHGQSWKDVMLS